MKFYIASIFLFLGLSDFLIAQNHHSKIFKTTADQLDKMFQENELSASEKLSGKLVEITGIVASIGKTMGDPYVSLELEDSFLSVTMFVENSEIKTLLSLKKGQTISVICKEVSYFMSPIGKNCAIKKREK